MAEVPVRKERSERLVEHKRVVNEECEVEADDGSDEDESRRFRDDFRRQRRRQSGVWRLDEQQGLLSNELLY